MKGRKDLLEKEVEYLKKYLPSNELEEGIQRLQDGEPVQYIVGNVDFYGNKIIVNNNVLIPRFETELLVEKTIKYIKNKFNDKIDILDIGTGSGAIAITLDKEINCNIDGVDISSVALDIAKENNRINNTNVNLFISDVFDNVNKKYDVIISNPPYISKDEEIMDIVKNNEPHLALYADMDGLYFYDKILKECKNYLKDNFIIAFEIGWWQADKIVNIANKYLDNVNILVEKDYSDKDRFIFIMNG